MPHLRAIGTLALALALACAGPGDLPALSPEPAPAGVARTSDLPAWTELAVFLPTSDPDAAERWRAAARAAWPEASVHDAAPTEVGLGVWISSPGVADYAVPPPDALLHFGVGLREGEAERVAAAKTVVVADWFADGADAYRVARLADRTAHDLAAAAGGWIWDEQARTLYPPEVFAERRLADGWVGEVPLVAAHTSAHAYDDGGYQRVVTVGMQKLGLPDLVINGILDRHQPFVGRVPELVGQALAQGAQVGPGGSIAVDLGVLVGPEYAELLALAREQGGTGVLEVTLRVAELHDGDATNRLWEIDFGESAPAQRYAATEAALVRTFGTSWTEQPVIQAPADDAALARVAEEARATLARLRSEGALLSPGTTLLVKAPFATPAGSVEWMWVEVRAIEDGAWRGALVNQPFDIPSLQVGSVVAVSADEVADYLFTHADGTEEGGRSSEILERRQTR